MTKCATCSQDVVDTGTGLILNPQAGRLGRHLKDGTILTGDQIRDPTIRGYYEHHCLPKHITPKRPSSQDSLF